jgi:hypothetical protein
MFNFNHLELSFEKQFKMFDKKHFYNNSKGKEELFC